MRGRSRLFLLLGCLVLVLLAAMGSLAAVPAAKCCPSAPLPAAVAVVAEGEGDELIVLTFNIRHGRRPTRGRNLDDVARIIAESGAHLVGLQEVERRQVRSRFEDQVQVLAEMAGMHMAFGANLGSQTAGYGNAVLSRFPIQEVVNHPLPSSRERRGLLQVRVEPREGEEISFFVTHLGLSAAERRAHVPFILQQVQAVDTPVILVGDFNARPTALEVAMVGEVLIDAFDLAGEGAGGTFPAWTLPPRARIDYIFASPDFEVAWARVVEEPASDHYPVVAAFTRTAPAARRRVLYGNTALLTAEGG